MQIRSAKKREPQANFEFKSHVTAGEILKKKKKSAEVEMQTG
jgi:hypothetical protein